MDLVLIKSIWPLELFSYFFALIVFIFFDTNYICFHIHVTLSVTLINVYVNKKYVYKYYIKE